MSNKTVYTKRFLFLFLCMLIAAAGIAQPVRITVAKDGSGDFTSVQEAINAVKDSNTSVTTIYIKKGIYKEKLRLPEAKMNVHFAGEDVNNTLLTYDDYASKKDSTGKDIGTSGSASFFIFGSGFSAENISFENAAGPVGQAVAVRITGDRARFINCRFLGFQDTLYTHGNESRQYYFNCYIEGTVDFIFGSSTALFDSCTLFGKKGGYFTAASTPENKSFGYVFRNCIVTGNAAPESFYLGRPWRPFAKVVFLNCQLGSLIKKEGWNNWGNVANEKTALFAEYGNTGEGAAMNARVPWARQYSSKEAKQFTTAAILSGWNPLADHSFNNKN
ncbi:MAG: pectin esterase [Lacibacter sp.]|nr:pectin esterase [Lacibacter sp.]